MSKKIISILLVVSIMLTNCFTIFANTDTATIINVDGTVNVQRSGSSKVFNAFENMTVTNGDKILTGTDGSATIVVNEKNSIGLGKNTSITLNNINNAEDDIQTSYTLNYGSASNEVNTKGLDFFDYKVNTTNTVMGVRGTVFDVAKKLNENGNEAVQLITIEGKVAVDETKYDESGNTTLEETAAVTAEQTISFSVDGSDNGEVVALDLTKLDADQLRWLKENEEFLSEENQEKISVSLENAEKIETEKVNLIEKAVEKNSSNKASSNAYEIIEKVQEKVAGIDTPNKTEEKVVNDENSEGSSNKNDNSNSNTTEKEEPNIELPTEPVEPITPVVPVEPITPVEPVPVPVPVPDEPTTPVVPVEPITPVIPVTPEIPNIPIEEVEDDEDDNENETIEATNPIFELDPEDSIRPIDEENPEFYIGNTQELKDLNTYLLNNRTYDTIKIVLENDINFENNVWTPVSVHNLKFDGNNKTISNVKINRKGSNENVGLFDELKESIVFDLILKGFDVAYDPTSNFTGILAGKVEDSYINNVVVCSSNVAGKRAGGLSGLIKNTTLKNVDIHDIFVTGYNGAGGIAAEIEGNVSGVHVYKSSIVATSGNAGGVAGSISGNVSASFANNVTLTTDKINDLLNSNSDSENENAVLVANTSVLSNSGYAGGIAGVITGNLSGIFIGNTVVTSNVRANEITLGYHYESNASVIFKNVTIFGIADRDATTKNKTNDENITSGSSIKLEIKE